VPALLALFSRVERELEREESVERREERERERWVESERERA
jgi:hypothetical protein